MIWLSGASASQLFEDLHVGDVVKSWRLIVGLLRRSVFCWLREPTAAGIREIGIFTAANEVARVAHNDWSCFLIHNPDQRREVAIKQTANSALFSDRSWLPRRIPTATVH